MGKFSLLVTSTSPQPNGCILTTFKMKAIGVLIFLSAFLYCQANAASALGKQDVVEPGGDCSDCYAGFVCCLAEDKNSHVCCAEGLGFHCCTNSQCIPYC